MNLERYPKQTSFIGPVCCAMGLLCPECGNEWVHLDGVEVTMNDSVTSVDGRTVVQSGSSNNHWNRGPTVRIALWCEEGHHTWVDLREHKGNVFVEGKQRSKDDGIAWT